MNIFKFWIGKANKIHISLLLLFLKNQTFAIKRYMDWNNILNIPKLCKLGEPNCNLISLMQLTQNKFITQ